MPGLLVRVILGLILIFFCELYPSAAQARPRDSSVPAAAEQSLSPSRIEVRFATVAAIRNRHQGITIAYKIHTVPPVIVLEYSSLHAQALALDRVAALIEKQHAPRDRILSQPELRRLIRSTGNDFDHFYQGHDYRATDIVRFMSLSDRHRVSLNPEEVKLRMIIAHEKWVPATVGALISIPPIGRDIDAPARDAILTHELSHAAYFTDSRYADLAKKFWTAALSVQERTAIREFLSTLDYDSTNEDLMINEAQAYLFNTPDPRLFTSAMVGMTDKRHAELRLAFIQNVPAGWFRDMVAASPGE